MAPEDHDGTLSVMAAVLADRSKQQLGEATPPPGAKDQERRRS